MRHRVEGDVVRAADGEVHNENDVGIPRMSNEVVRVMGKERESNWSHFYMHDSGSVAFITVRCDGGTAHASQTRCNYTT